MKSLISNKRGQGMSTSTIVLLILGIIVLVVLILGFTMGWQSITPWLSNSNVDSVSTACSVVCSTGKTYGFCSSPRELRTEEDTFEDVTCNYMAKEMPNFGVEECPGISCSQVIVDLQGDETLEDKCNQEQYQGKTIQAMVDMKIETKSC